MSKNNQVHLKRPKMCSNQWRSPARRVWMSAIVLAALWAALVPATPTAAYSAELPSESGIGPSAVTTVDGSGLRETAQFLAGQFGVDVSTALARLNHQEEVAPLLADWWSRYPDAYGGAHRPDGFAIGTTVRWVGQPPNDVVAAAAAVSPHIGFDVTADVSAATLVGLAEQVNTRMAEAGFAGYATEPDLRNQNISISAWGDGPENLSRTSIQDVVGALLPASVGLDVEAVTSSPSLDAATRGGTAAVRSGRTQASCTFAFTVKQGSRWGVLTAGHCSNDLDYLDPVTGRTRNATFEEEHIGYYGDFAWYSVSGTASDRFHISRTSSLQVTSVKAWQSIAIGDYYCHYGQRSNKTRCGTVHGTNLCFQGDTSSCNQVRISGATPVAQGGDSGGPWYSGSTAVGIYKGRWTTPWGVMHYFTPVDIAADDLGVEVVIH
ncbi:MAG: S1 family peptidase [Acidimicrobiaceae bacterium]|nr:S1 family peptidase [Acidimicrobiaceae bacterium]